MNRLTERDFKFTSNYVAQRLQAFPMAQCLSKLQEYEDAEEQGLIVRLPCKPNDIIYFIGYDFSKCSEYGEEYNECSCQGCEALCDSEKIYSVYPTRAEDLHWILINYFNFGKTYFTTKEDAEKALAESEGNND